MMNVQTVRDSRLNNSDKLLQVPSGETWRLLSANVAYTSTATAGNRQMRLSIIDPDGVEIGYISSGSFQPASTARRYVFMHGVTRRETAFIDDVIQVPIPVESYLPAGSIIRFYDAERINTEADDMLVSFQIEKIVA